MPKPSFPERPTLQGHIERITFRNDNTHFMIAKFKAAEQPGLVTILGHLPDPHPGETLRLTGQWQTHPRFGQQFNVTSVDVLLPAQVDEIRRYLSGGLIKGIGPHTAENLIRHFGDQTIAVLEEEPDRLCEVSGIGPKKADQIVQAWQTHHSLRTLMRFLQDHDIKPAYGARIYKTYGDGALAVLQNDPYRLTIDMPRAGFYIYDAILRRSGGPVDPERHAQACLRHLLEEAFDDGHMFLMRDEIFARCGTAFELDYHQIQNAIEVLDQAHDIKSDPQAPQTPVYLYALYQAETQIARRLQALTTRPPTAHSPGDETILAAVVQRMAIALTETQLAVIKSALRQSVVIITGGPGTGKTTLIRALAAVFDALGRDYVLAAPTGRASRRMAEVTSRPAVTLHKLLGFNLAEGGFERNQDNPLEVETVIVDEASMVDTVLMSHLLKAMPLHSRLILVGDVYQLPSVGPGTVLADLIDAGVFATFELRQIFRQAAQSPIIALAHRVHQGILPEWPSYQPDRPLSEVTFIPENDLGAIAEAIVTLCARTIPGQLGLDGIAEVQVLTPMHKGPAGTLALNQILQARLNPGQGGLQWAGGTFRVGDKVMHLRNNYQKEVFNGEIGTISRLDRETETLTVTYDGRNVTYDPTDMEELTLAYAISVHKSQGSEYPVIILPMVTQHYVMLQRNLLYTALTRARQMVVLIGSAKAIRVAVETDKPRQRHSLLGWRLNPESFKEIGTTNDVA
jgi:exodeoxyribonuclease V alpha subunit